MSDLRERYPARSFLLQKERRFLVRRTDGSFDPVALKNAHAQLAFAPIEPDARTRLQKSITRVLCVGDAVKKGAWSYSDLEAAGKLHTSFGFPIVIEVPDGGTRSGTSKDGTKWETKLDGMSYGFLPDTIAADAEELDAIVGKDITAPMAFVIDQGDECKLALGYATAQDARGAYEKNWPAGMLKEMFQVPMEVVRALLGVGPSSLSNAVYAAKRMSGMSGGTVVVTNGVVIGEIRKSVADVSMEQLRDMALKPLRALLMPDVPASTPAYQVDIWIVDTYDDTLVYSYQSELWRIAYRIVGDAVVLAGDPIRVKRTYEAATLQTKSAMDVGSFVGGVKLPAQSTEDAHAHKGRYDDIDFSIPNGVAEEAQRGLDWRAEHGRGGTDVGVATARTLVSEKNVSPQKARHIAEYFPRHEVDKKGEGYNPDEPGFPSNGRIAWALWGGDAGRAWSEKLVEQMNLRDDRANKSRFQRDIQLVHVAKAADEAKPLLVYSVVLEPEPNDGAGDLHRETYSEDFVRQTAHDYTAWYLNLDDQHGEFLPATRAVVVESYVTKQEEQWGERVVKKGTWIMGIRIYCPELKRQILAGEKTGLSIEGFAERVPNTPQSTATFTPAA
jgi:hypothetical protein